MAFFFFFFFSFKICYLGGLTILKDIADCYFVRDSLASTAYLKEGK
jgi:hypothetical protein